MITGPRKLVKKAAFIADILGIADIDFNVHIKRKKLKSISAECEQIDQFNYKLTIGKGFDKVTETELIGHEMVHVKQYVMGQLVDVKQTPTEGHYLWNGKPYVSGNTMDDYYLTPWELEARALEDWIVYRWSKRLAIRKN